MQTVLMMRFGLFDFLPDVTDRSASDTLVFQ
jgi:hypothetical protein